MNHDLDAVGIKAVWPRHYGREIVATGRDIMAEFGNSERLDASELGYWQTLTEAGQKYYNTYYKQKELI